MFVCNLVTICRVPGIRIRSISAASFEVIWEFYSLGVVKFSRAKKNQDDATHENRVRVDMAAAVAEAVGVLLCS
jgi:hypothetical protein